MKAFKAPLQIVFCCAQEGWWCMSDWDMRHLNLVLRVRKFKMLTLKSIFSQVQYGDWFGTIKLKDAYFYVQIVKRQEVPQICFQGQSIPLSSSSIRTGSSFSNIHKMYGCSSGPVAAAGHPNFELPGRLANSNSISGSGTGTLTLGAQSPEEPIGL